MRDLFEAREDVLQPDFVHLARRSQYSDQKEVESRVYWNQVEARVARHDGFPVSG